MPLSKGKAFSVSECLDLRDSLDEVLVAEQVVLAVPGVQPANTPQWLQRRAEFQAGDQTLDVLVIEDP